MNPANDWIDTAGRLLDALRGGLAAPADEETSHSSDCRWCPVCQVAAVVRGERPEVTAALADVLTATAAALRTFAEAGEPPAADDAAEAETDAEPPPAVQRIEIA
jgi:hypothetical protein